METSMKLNDKENFKNEMIKGKISDGRECQRVQKKFDSKNRVTKVTTVDKNVKEMYTKCDSVGIIYW